jgi:hypothetical protein
MKGWTVHQSPWWLNVPTDWEGWFAEPWGIWTPMDAPFNVAPNALMGPLKLGHTCGVLGPCKHTP